MRSNAKSTGTPEAPQPAAPGEAMAAQIRQTILDALMRIGAAGDTPDHAALTVERAREPIAPSRLARAHPGDAAARAAAQRLYERCLEHYRSTVRPQDQTRGVDDVGAAVAAFVAANLGALHGTPVTPHMLLRVERQLGGIARLSSDWAHAPAIERQAYFEQMAVLAVLVGESSAQAASQGAAALANVRRAARGYMQQLLGLDPDHLVLGPDGIAARSPSAATS